MPDKSSMTHRIGVFLGTIATAATIGSAGHCYGVQGSASEIERLKTALGKQMGGAEGVATGSSLNECQSQLGLCKVSRQQLEAQNERLQAALDALGAGSPTQSTRGEDRKLPQSQMEETQNANFLPVYERKGFRVEFDECKLSGSELHCVFKVTSTEKDLRLHLRRVRLIESTGKEIVANNRDFGSFGKRAFVSMVIGGDLVQGIPLRVSAEFSGVSPSDSGELPLIELEFDLFSAQFRDAPIR